MKTEITIFKEKRKKQKNKKENRKIYGYVWRVETPRPGKDKTHFHFYDIKGIFLLKPLHFQNPEEIEGKIHLLP